MGYTHYWRVKPNADEVAYQSALADIRRLIENSSVRLGDGMGESSPEVGEGISFNGWREDGDDCETFSLPHSLSDLGNFDFCKTDRRPYDVVVVAALAVLKERLGECVEVTSDGGADDWERGVLLASETLGRLVPNPMIAGAQND